MRASLLALLALTSASCVSAEFSRLRVDQAPAEEAVAQLAVGMDLTQCLEILGAPTSVTRDDEGIRTVLVWEWLEAGGFGVSLSVPLTDQSSASVDYGSDSQKMRQIQVFLDSEWKVVSISREAPR